jgi:hypothetical protein
VYPVEYGKIYIEKWIEVKRFFDFFWGKEVFLEIERWEMRLGLGGVGI